MHFCEYDGTDDELAEVQNVQIDYIYVAGGVWMSSFSVLFVDSRS